MEHEDATQGQPHMEAGRGTVILPLGIIALVFNGFCCFPLSLALGIPAYKMGKKDLDKMMRGEMADHDRKTTKAGMILGLIGMIWGGINVAIVLLFVLFFGGLASLPFLGELFS